MKVKNVCSCEDATSHVLYICSTDPISPGAGAQENYQSKSLNLPYTSLGPFEDVQLFQEWDYKLMFSCAFHASVP